MYEIIKNAPPLGKKSGKHDYPFAIMEVWDKFIAPRDMGKYKQGGDVRQRSIAVYARRWGGKNNPTAKFITRIVDAETVACQRIA